MHQFTRDGKSLNLVSVTVEALLDLGSKSLQQPGSPFEWDAL